MASGNGAAAAKDRKPTKYVVLKQVNAEDAGVVTKQLPDELWTPVITVEAKNGPDAEKKAAIELGPGKSPSGVDLYAEGAYKAVAESSWDGGQFLFNESDPRPKSRPLNGASIESRVEEGASA
jgi:hypothetical protein